MFPSIVIVTRFVWVYILLGILMARAPCWRRVRWTWLTTASRARAERLCGLGGLDAGGRRLASLMTAFAVGSVYLSVLAAIVIVHVLRSVCDAVEVHRNPTLYAFSLGPVSCVGVC